MNSGRFVKGQVAWNKGLKRYWNSPTEFRKGLIPWNKKEHLIKICPTCNKQFDVKPSLDRVIYCSISCAKKGKPSPMKGKSPSLETRMKIAQGQLGRGGSTHWNWKHGKTKLYNSHYQSAEYKKWRRTVFIRDEFTCQECKNKNIYIVAHHINPVVSNPESIYDVDNGLTVCLECHSKFHKKKMHRRIL